MKHSNTELIVERYYRFRNWLVERDVPILPRNDKKHWSDIDILAVGEEVHLINCKDFLPSNKDIEKVIKNLDDAEDYIKQEYNHLANKEFKKFYIYAITGKPALDIARNNNIETVDVKELFVKYLKLLDESLAVRNIGRKDIPKGKRYYIVGELEGLDKFIAFLLNYNFINDKVINELLKEIGLSELSKPK